MGRVVYESLKQKTECKEVVRQYLLPSSASLLAVEWNKANSKPAFFRFLPCMKIEADAGEAQAILTPLRHHPVHSELTWFATMQDAHFPYLFKHGRSKLHPRCLRAKIKLDVTRSRDSPVYCIRLTSSALTSKTASLQCYPNTHLSETAPSMRI